MNSGENRTRKRRPGGGGLAGALSDVRSGASAAGGVRRARRNHAESADSGGAVASRLRARVGGLARSMRPTSSWGSALKTLCGAGMLWAWQYATFLSTALFLPGQSIRGRSELETGFYLLQAAAMVFAVCLVVAHYRRPIRLSTGHTFLAAGGLTLSTLGLFVALRIHSLVLVAVSSVFAGVCTVVMVGAWGARFSLGSKSSGQLVVVSFLLACAIYLSMAMIPNEVAVGVLLALPLGSWVCWMSDATARHSLSSNVFGRADESAAHADRGAPSSPEELTAGTWRLRAIPWRAVSVLVAASFVGALVASLLTTMTRGSAGDIFHNGAWVVAIVCVLTSLAMLREHNALSVRSMYHIMVTLTVFGLLVLLVFGRLGFVVGGAFAQGCSLFLQIMIYVIMTRSTQRFDMAPLFSFSVGQAVVAGVVLAGSLAGRAVYELARQESLMLPLTCGFGILVLFYMVTSHVGRSEELFLSRTKMGAGARAEAAEDDADLDEEEDGASCEPARTPVPGPGSETLSCGEASAFPPAAPSPASASAVVAPFPASSPSTAPAFEEPGDPEALERDRLDRFAQTYGLTTREAEVFAYLAHGRSRPYIADALFVTTGTVKTHTTHIYRKLEVGSKQELIDLYESFR
uniref:HTH luxR-type domain-containing protein n=1 Tax=Muribaculaceae bacterium Z82 TaxID=2304548 RepID=A0A7C9JIG5_9BACT